MKKKIIFTALIMLVLIGATTLRIAQAKAHSMDEQRAVYTLPWSVISSGGLGNSVGEYTLKSTLGQPVAGAVDGGTFHVTSGFWTEIMEAIEAFFNYLPLIIR
jgi:hypothetical protein